MSQWNHSIQYHEVLLRAVPSGCQQALDVGCGTGFFTRQLASRSDAVTAMDADHDTLERARAATPESRVTFVEGDVMTYPFRDRSFDFIAVIATLHHLPLAPALARFLSLLKPGGSLGVIGLYRGQTVTDTAFAALAFHTSWLIRGFRDHAPVEAPLQEPRESLREIKTAFDATLPGTRVRRHLLFRYSAVWHKP
jgi:ubiquinone/menaquinone biosynthesis C-methylase UbiE